MIILKVSMVTKLHDKDIQAFEISSALLVLCKENHQSPVDSPHKGQWREIFMFYLIYASRNGWANNRDAGELRRHRAHYDVIVMHKPSPVCCVVMKPVNIVH